MEDTNKLPKTNDLVEKENNNLETIELQKTLFSDEVIEIKNFKNYPEKQRIKKEIISKFNNMMFRSILVPREEANLRKFRHSLSRDKGAEGISRDSAEGITRRLKKFSTKTIDTISVFPSLLTNVFTLLHTKVGEKVFDPFVGHNERAEDVLDLGRKYYGYDIYKFPINFTKQSLISQYHEGKDYFIEQKSSEKIDYDDESFDFIFSCPPYLDVEKYDKIYEEDKEKGDLSCGNVDEFKKLMEKVLKECYRILKPNKTCIFIMGDIFRQRKLIPLHLYTIESAKKAGFTLYDINIYNRKSNIGGDINYVHFIRNLKKLPTIHEYILIFKKEEK